MYTNLIHQFFVIEDPGRNLNVRLKVTGFYPKCRLDRWAIYGQQSSDFCIKTCDGRKLNAYTNSKAEVGMIKRTYNPLLLDYVNIVLAEYFFNPGEPCLAPSSNRIISPNEEDPFVIITVTSAFGDVNNYRGSKYYDGFFTYGCGNSYTYPTVKLSNNNILGWLSTPADDKAQFLLGSALNFKLSNITVSGQSQTPQQAGIPPDTPKFDILPAEYSCNPQDLAFYNVNTSEPVEFIPEESIPHPPLVTDAGNTIAMFLSQGSPPDDSNVKIFTLKSEPDQQFTFTTGSVAQGFIPFAIRLNTPIWEYNLDADAARYVAFGPGILKAEMRLTLLGVNV